MYPGGGAQYVRMGMSLYGAEPVFREYLDRGLEELRPKVDFDLRDLLFASDENLEKAAAEFERPSVQLPAIFIIEYALSKLWISWGVEPTAMIGHSMGENTAACIAGVFSYSDALSLVTLRGRLVESIPGGGMISISASEQDILPMLGDELDIASVNIPGSCVVSGPISALDSLSQRLVERGIESQRVRINIAAHSWMLDPILEKFKAHVSCVKLNPPLIPFISNCSGSWITTEQALSPDYWTQHLRRTIRFADGVRELLKEPDRIFLEVGPGQTLSGFLHQHPDRADHQVAISSLRHPFNQQPDEAFLLNSLGQLWAAGARIDWGGYHAGEGRRRVPLPTYPFQRQSYWIDSTHFLNRDVGIPQDNGSPGFWRRPGVSLNIGNKIRQLASPLKAIIRRIAILKNGKTLQDKAGSLSSQVSGESAQFRAPADGPTERVIYPRSDYVAPRTPLEAEIASIWQEELGISQISVHDDFFMLGGTSILVSRIIFRLNRAFQVELPIISLLESPTIAGLAECLELVLREQGVAISSS
jgi:acyl transferase domain-containing protein